MNFNPYYNPNMMNTNQNSYTNQFLPQQRIMQPEPYMQPQPIRQATQGLQGKSVDNIEVVKAMDIPLDWSISYFPLTDGSAIVTKQLQSDGTSKIIVYKPVEEKEEQQKIKYITLEQLDERLKDLDTDDYKDTLKAMKRQIKDLQDNIEELNEKLEKGKDD